MRKWLQLWPVHNSNSWRCSCYKLKERIILMLLNSVHVPSKQLHFLLWKQRTNPRIYLTCFVLKCVMFLTKTLLLFPEMGVSNNGSLWNLWVTEIEIFTDWIAKTNRGNQCLKSVFISWFFKSFLFLKAHQQISKKWCFEK